MIMDVLPRILIGIAHNKTLNDHPLPIQAWHKSLRSIVANGEPIVARRDVGTINVEGELAVIIGRDTAGLTVDNAFDYVAGFTIANDVTNVDRNAEDEKIFQGKGGLGYTPLGPRVVDVAARSRAHVDPRLRQRRAAGRLRHPEAAVHHRGEPGLRGLLGAARTG